MVYVLGKLKHRASDGSSDNFGYKVLLIFIGLAAIVGLVLWGVLYLMYKNKSKPKWLQSKKDTTKFDQTKLALFVVGVSIGLVLLIGLLYMYVF